MAHSKQTVEKVTRFLIKKAQERQAVVYADVAKACGLPTTGSQLGQSLGPILDDINTWCMHRGNPTLSALVVRKSGEDQGLPGKGFWDLVAPQLTDRASKHIYLDAVHTQLFNYYEMY